MVACSPRREGAIPHPPSFEDIMKHSVDILDPDRKEPLEEAVKKTMLLHEALRFTPQELDAIQRSSEPPHLVGAGLQDATCRGLELLWWAAKDEPGNPVALAGLAYVCLGTSPWREFFEKKTPEFEGVEAVIERLKKADPENSLPYYLEACLRAQEGDAASAAPAMATAAEKNVLETYRLHMCRRVIAAAESLGYSKFAARLHGLSAFAGVGLFNGLCKAMLERPEASEEDARACLLLGERHEGQSKLMIDALVALSIQKQALEKLPENEAAGELERIEKRVAEFREAHRMMTSLRKDKSITEERWVRYFDEMFSISEYEAIVALAREKGVVERRQPHAP